MNLLNPSLSVIMPVFNVEDFVAEAIDSILNQDYKDFELIIIDDCSNDKTYEIVQKFVERDTRIRLIRNEFNRGIVWCLNTAILEAKGTFIARMDGDDVSHPCRFTKQMEFLRINKLNLVGCQGECISKNGKVVKRLNYPCKHTFCKLFLKQANCMAHPSWLGERELFLKLQYRDIQTCEDYDFLVRTVLEGYKIGNLSERVFYYRLNPRGISSRNNSEQILVANRIANAYRKNDIISFSEYEQWKNSDDYRDELEKLEVINRKIEKIKALNISNFKKGIYLLTNTSWRCQKIGQVCKCFIVFLDKVLR